MVALGTLLECAEESDTVGFGVVGCSPEYGMGMESCESVGREVGGSDCGSTDEEDVGVDAVAMGGASAGVG